MKNAFDHSAGAHRGRRRRRGIAGLAALALAAGGVVAVQATAGAQEPEGPRPTLIDGAPTAGEYPFIASVGREFDDVTDHWCGGVLIDPEWVATRATCVVHTPGHPEDRTRVPVDADSLTLRIGSPDRTAGGTTAEVAEVVVHPDGLRPSREGSGQLALLRLADAVGEEPVEPTAQEPAPGDELLLLGWGRTAADGPPEPVRDLRQLAAAVVPDEECHRGEEPISAYDFCADAAGTAGTTRHDAGGPVLCETDEGLRLVGVIATTGVAGPGTPTVVAPVHTFREWIDTTIDS